jgi:DNA-binding transcriptional MerR regulator
MHPQVDLKSRGASLLDIAEVARKTGLPASTLRYYEEKGLIRSVARRGLRRLFETDVLQRLAIIGLGRVSGFSLDETAKMFAPDGRPRIDREMLAAKADELDGKIAKLSAMRDGLRHAVACRAPSHMECPTFQRLLRAVLSGAIRPEQDSVPEPPAKRRREKTRRAAAGAAAKRSR